jgi:hypothetical protein
MSTSTNVIPETELQVRRQAKAIVRRVLRTLAGQVAPQPAPICPHCGRLMAWRRPA